MNIYKAARTKAGLTQRGVSEITTVPLRTIQDWESGARVPPPYVTRWYLKELSEIEKNKKTL
jgi:Predicted transcriptional regulator